MRGWARLLKNSSNVTFFELLAFAHEPDHAGDVAHELHFISHAHHDRASLSSAFMTDSTSPILQFPVLTKSPLSYAKRAWRYSSLSKVLVT